MSFDIFLRAFSEGEPSNVDATALRSDLDEYVNATDGQWASIRTADGGADLYGYDTLERGFMVTHASGTAIWDLLVTVASIHQLAIIPVGSPACVTAEGIRGDLPGPISRDAVVISTGSDLLHVIEQG